MSSYSRQLAVSYTVGVMIFGDLCSFIALLTIQRARYLQNSFGTICTFQMVCDVIKITLSTLFSLIPADFAPVPSSIISISISVICEAFYFTSCLMHVLFAIHRLIFIVFPKWKYKWERTTNYAIAFCCCFGTAKALLPLYIDRNLYCYIDRAAMCWYFTDTPMTAVYISMKVALSYAEIIIVIVLDAISFAKLLSLRRKVLTKFWDAKTSFEMKLVIQSLLQCVPTLTLMLIYFQLMPTLTDDFAIFLCSLSWNVSSGMDGLIIVLLQTRTYLMRKSRIVQQPKKLMTPVPVRTVTTSTRNATPPHLRNF